jgi:hypothetical protein
MALRVPLTLREGRNVVVVAATDPIGTTVQEARVIFYDRPKEVAAPPAAPSTGREAMKPGPAAPPKVTPAPPVVSTVAPAPVTFSILSPAHLTKVDQESLPMAGVVRSGKGLAGVVVTLNGIEVSRLQNPAPQPAVSLTSVLKLREGANLLVVAATETDGTVHQEVRAVAYERRVPLTVEFRYPGDGARVTEETNVVAAVVTSSKGVSRTRVILNGVETYAKTEPVPQASVVVTAPVTLKEGTNTVLVTGSEPDGTTQQELRTITFARPKPVPAAAPATPRIVRELWAVIVGVGTYEHANIPPLRYAAADAEALYQVLTQTAGLKKENVILLSDRAARKPTLRNIKWALGTFLARSARRDDTVLVFFAGHGAPEIDPRGLERDGFAKYLVPSDADADDLYSTALPMDELQTIFGRIEAERVVAFVDACYSGAAGGRTFLASKTRSGSVDDLFLERLTRSKGRAIITASRATELAIELPELGHGIFTHYLVQGLKGAGDLNRDGIVSVQELYEYVENEVVRKSRAVGGNQHPLMKGELEGPVPLVRVKPR